MSHPSGPRRRWAALCTALAACALSAIPTAGATEPAGHHAAKQGPAHARVRTVRIDPDPDPVPVGGNVTVRILHANQGPDATVSPFTVTVVLPPYTTATGPFFPTSCLADPTGTTITCPFPGGLPNQRTAEVLIPAQVAATAPAHRKLGDGTVTVTNPDDPDATVHAVNFALRTA
ncbi:hypothetical protein [Streptacidiphilus sp. EB129]|uniref:hypothetical protein n=1 Tax=Streptacidiphilus sp. EB129 TaxID=3156262 RepID=UPI003515086C